MKQPKYPCRNCIYFKACGDNTRTTPCKGRMTKREQEMEIRLHEYHRQARY